MKKTILALALGLLAPGAFAQNFVCGHTGFNSNIGSTAKSFRCAPRTIVRGVGTLTFNATTTVTVSPAGFQSIAPPEAVPGADATFFRASGLMLSFAGETYFLNVTAKASDSSLTAALGGAAVAFSGTTTVWSFWSTDCYRTANADGIFTSGDTVVNTSPRIWATNALLSSLSQSSSGVYRGRGVAYAQAAGATATSALSGRVAGLVTQFATISITGFSLPGLPTTARHVSQSQMGTTVPVLGNEWQFTMQSGTANTFGTICAYVPAPAP